MNLKIGTIIKNLRMKNKVTQDQLATFLGVTPQAISRWEAESSYPDIELLPSIAEFFSVSTDDLLGLNRSEREKRLAEIYDTIERRFDTNHFGEKDISIARGFMAEFPSDERVQIHLADSLRRAYLYDETSALHLKELEEAEKIYLALIERTNDQNIRNDAVASLASLYTLGFHDTVRAERIMNLLSPISACREGVRSHVLSHNRNDLKPAQEYIACLTAVLCRELTEYIAYMMPNEVEGWNQKIEYLEKVIDLYRTVFGENMNLYHGDVAYVHRVISTYLLSQGRYDEALDQLEIMCDHVIAADQTEEGAGYASPFVDCLTSPYRTQHDSELKNINYSFFFWLKMRQERYAPVRENPRFQEVVARLKATARDFG